MSDLKTRLQALFKEEHRYENFGSAISRMHLQGFRCHASTPIDFNSPITAFCGLNGTGKSTLIQIAAAAYRPPQGVKRFYIRDFIVAGKLDANPFSPDASVRYEYLREGRSGVLTYRPQVVTVSRHASKWTGYKRQPVRHVYFAGMGLYLPKIEHRDFVVRHADKLIVSESGPLSEGTKETICRILACGYEAIDSHTVSFQHHSTKVVTVSRDSATYSEANMGCGEGRVQHIIRAMEALPEKSLVLLEEPETSLHPSAQHEFSKFLLQICVDRKHQILLTTHSEFILQVLPAESRVYLNRVSSGIDLIPGLMASQAKSLMAGGMVKALHVLVEDDCAKYILTEIIRRIDPTFLKAIAIYDLGDKDFIGKTVAKLQATGIPIAAVRDGDKEGNVKDNIFKLPGTFPPEKEMFANASVKDYVAKAYGMNMNDFMSGLRGVDHHDWISRLANELSLEKTAIATNLASVYARAIPETEAHSLTDLLKAAIKR